MNKKEMLLVLISAQKLNKSERVFIDNGHIFADNKCLYKQGLNSIFFFFVKLVLECLAGTRKRERGKRKERNRKSDRSKK